MHRMFGLPSPLDSIKKEDPRKKIAEIFNKKQEPKTVNEPKITLTKNIQKK